MTTRRTFNTAAAAALIGMGIAPGAIAQRKTELIFSSVNPPDVPLSKAITGVLAKNLGDDIDFKVYFGGTLAQQGAELTALQRGNIHMGHVPPQEFAQQAPEFGMLAAPFVIRDAAHLQAVFRSKVGDDLKKIARDKLRVQLLAPAYYGTRHVSLRSDKAINRPEDMRGVKLRMPGGENWQMMGRALGANPVPIAYPELYTSLQSGVVDGHDNPLPNIRGMKFYEVTKQVALTSHNVGFLLVATGAKYWDSLSADQQRRLQAATDQAFAWSHAETLKQEKELVDFLKAQGLKINTPDVKAFQVHAQKMYLDSPLAASWPKPMLDAINAL